MCHARSRTCIPARHVAHDSQEALERNKAPDRWCVVEDVIGASVHARRRCEIAVRFVQDLQDGERLGQKASITRKGRSSGMGACPMSGPSSEGCR